jgi:DNA/RNA-binding domain of Phe-tRNA-synthetase-like protein
VLDLSIDERLRSRAHLGVLVLEELRVSEADPGLEAEVAACGADFRKRHPEARSGDVPGVEEARSLYKALGLDPTKTRPSNEALLRRVLKGEALYRVNTLVDAANLASLRFQLPFGLYDLDRIEPPVTLRLGRAGEVYEGIRKGDVNVEGRPVLCDALGPFGNPTSDSARTMITLGTRRCLLTVYGPAASGSGRLPGVLEGTEAIVLRFCGGRRVERRVLAGR